METITAILVTLFSVLIPTKTWFPPDQPLTVKIDAKTAVTLVLTDYKGLRINTDAPTRAEPGTTVDVRAIFPGMRVGTYLLYAAPVSVPEPRATHEYVGTPLVIELRGDDRPGAASGAIVVRVEPLCIAKFDTSVGAMAAAFYYDVAPNTVSNFIGLAREGFYDGLMFHRVVPNFVVQAGDPLGDGSGGPGYTISAEFNPKPHLAGVLSMAREGDPMESQGAMPRPEYANTAGSQFFICLNYDKTKRLDRKYTTFGQLISGDDTLKKIGAGEIEDAGSGRPKSPVTIRSIRIEAVHAGDDPYPTISIEENVRQLPTNETSTAPTAAPATAPAAR